MSHIDFKKPLGILLSVTYIFMPHVTVQKLGYHILFSRDMPTSCVQSISQVCFLVKELVYFTVFKYDYTKYFIQIFGKGLL